LRGKALQKALRQTYATRGFPKINEMRRRNRDRAKHCVMSDGAIRPDHVSEVCRSGDHLLAFLSASFGISCNADVMEPRHGQCRQSMRDCGWEFGAIT
jgi:hypothetical protein